MATLLADMEETLGRVKRIASREYMDEALRCYQASAYRACVVMSAIALFDDLRAKISELAKVNKIAKDISEDVSKKQLAQDVFENYLAEKLIKSQLVDATQENKLKIIRDLRNKAAHPSGVHASAEEARFVFFETIDKFLAQEQLQTTHAVDAVIDRLVQANFFPSNNIEEIEQIVKVELSIIDKAAFGYLVNKIGSECNSTDATVKKNSRYFLAGLCRLNDSGVRLAIRKNVILTYSGDVNSAEMIMMLAAIDPGLLDTLVDGQLGRIKVLISRVISTTGPTSLATLLSHPLMWFKSTLSHHGQEKSYKLFQDQIDAILVSYNSDASMIAALSENGVITDKYIEGISKRAGSSDFGTANSAAQQLSTLDSMMGSFISNEASFKIITNVSKAAQYGAWSSVSLLSSNFSGLPNLKEKAVKFVEEFPEQAAEEFIKYGLKPDFKDWSEASKTNG